MDFRGTYTFIGGLGLRGIENAASPLFAMVMGAVVEGSLGRGNLRQFGAGYESSCLYHRAKNIIKTPVYLPVVIYLYWSWAVYPNLVLLPVADSLGVVVAGTIGVFKKYL
ncbi:MULTISPECIES: DUF4400 domain-containing protein [Pantoea]|uniref:DUF4400 domain-containing protein n=1 Tax=Pantoea TaxID=53335 RepID=UPI003AB6EAA9